MILFLKHKLDIKGRSEGFSDFNLLEGSEFQLAIANYQWEEMRWDDKRCLKMGVMNFDDGGEAGQASCMMWWCQQQHQLRNPMWQILCKANNNNNRILIWCQWAVTTSGLLSVAVLSSVCTFPHFFYVFWFNFSISNFWSCVEVGVPMVTSIPISYDKNWGTWDRWQISTGIMVIVRSNVKTHFQLCRSCYRRRG